MEQGSARWATTTGSKAGDHAFISQMVLALEEGRVGDAAQLVQATTWPARSPFTHRHQRWYNRALLAALEHDAAGARQAMQGYLDGRLRDSAWVVGELVGLHDALLEAGLPPAEVRQVPERFATHPSMPVVRPFAEGLLLAAEGDPAGAIAQITPALTTDGAVLPAPVRGSIRLSLATALLAEGDRAGALAEARRAHDDDLGRWPGWRRDRADALLRRLEGSAQRADGVLTAREREVAALIAQGLTNGQLADKLYISPKTAAVHVSNILTKLGLSGRAEVAAWAVRNGLESAA